MLDPFENDYLDRVAAAAARAGGPETSPEDFVRYARALLERGVPVLFSAEHSSFVLGVPLNDLAELAENPSRYYSRFRIAKGRGGSRTIDASDRRLKHVQRWIQRNITSRLPVTESAHGFRLGRSIRSNAAPHVGSRLVVQYDLRDFFGSVRRSVVEDAFRELGYSKDVAYVLRRLCTLRGVLPQGAPTSPDLANFAARRLDVRLEALARERDMRYTRYADDLTFSGAGAEDAAVRRTIEYIIRDAGFRPHEAKTRRLSRGTRQRVTGIVVNDKLNWPRDKRRWLRQELYYLERHGVEHHLKARGSTHARYREYIYGHVYALNMVRPDEAEAMLSRLDRVDWRS